MKKQETEKIWKDRISIKQYRPDTDEDESTYKTTFWGYGGIPIACGFGRNQIEADTDCLTKYIKIMPPLAVSNELKI